MNERGCFVSYSIKEEGHSCRKTFSFTNSFVCLLDCQVGEGGGREGGSLHIVCNLKKVMITNLLSARKPHRIFTRFYFFSSQRHSPKPPTGKTFPFTQQQHSYDVVVNGFLSKGEQDAKYIILKPAWCCCQIKNYRSGNWKHRKEEADGVKQENDVDVDEGKAVEKEDTTA